MIFFLRHLESFAEKKMNRLGTRKANDGKDSHRLRLANLKSQTKITKLH